MFDFLKKVFHGRANDAESSSESAVSVETSQPWTPEQAPTATAPAPVPSRPFASANGDGVEVSLQAVLGAFPLDLKGRIRQSDVGEATVSIPFDKVLSQLPSGSVRITFGELRRAAPQLFSPGSDCDQVQVPLPLNEILLQVDPSLLPRRTNQRRIEIPDEVRSPFGDIGNSLIFAVGPNKSAAPGAPNRGTTPATPARAEMPTPPPRSVTPAPSPRPEPPARAVAPVQPVRPTPEPQTRLVTPIAPGKPEAPVAPVRPAAPIAPLKADIPPAPMRPAAPVAPLASPRAPQPTPAPVVRTPIAPAAPTAPVRTPISPISAPPVLVAKAAPAAVPPVRVPAAPAMPITPIAPGAPATTFTSIAPAAAPRQPIAATPGTTHAVRPAAAPAPSPFPGADGPSLSVPLMSLVEAWPEALRYELVQGNLLDSQLVLPVEAIEQSLKRGRIAYPWKVLRMCLRPQPAPVVSAHDNVVLELPLKVVAPLFLNRQKEIGKSQQRVAIDDNIPNLFFGFPQPGQPGAAPAPGDTAAQAAPVPAAPAPAQVAATKPNDTNYYSWEDASNGEASVDTQFKRKAAGSPGTSFVTRCATPNEVVSRAAALDGVAGALIALPDGLMVASRLSSDLNGDTLAAFLPQIFSKVSQCTKELRMGELNNLNFTVGNVPWKIFRVNAIFFAAFGRPGQPLPTSQLVALAAELDRKKQ